MLNFILLMIFHIIGDFYLQSDKVARCKNARVSDKCKPCTKCKEKASMNFKYIVIHSLIYVIPFLLLLFMMDVMAAAIVIVMLTASHIVIDTISCCANKKLKATVVFLIDQAVHTGGLYLIFRFTSFNVVFSTYEGLIKIAFIVLLLIAPCSILINKLMEDTFPESVAMGLFDVGSIIGILERLLVIIFAYLGDLAAIAIIVTVKTWARTADLKENDFRNRYLLGTLASLVSAALVFMLYKIM